MSTGGVIFLLITVACAFVIVVAVLLAVIFKIDIIGFVVGIFKNLPDIVKKILNIALLPFRLFLRLFTVPSIPTDDSSKPATNTTNTTITKNVIGQCPPCNVTCPDTPSESALTKPLELEITYLKNMLKFVGTISKRENAINSQYREVYPGFSVTCPSVQRLSAEYNYLKNQLREDEGEYNYFKNYFTKLTGIPSTSSAVHYDAD
jgi:hypothetical protein